MFTDRLTVGHDALDFVMQVRVLLREPDWSALRELNSPSWFGRPEPSRSAKHALSYISCKTDLTGLDLSGPLNRAVNLHQETTALMDVQDPAQPAKKLGLILISKLPLRQLWSSRRTLADGPSLCGRTPGKQ